MSVVEFKNGILNGSKVAGFDLDDTLTSASAITPYPGVNNKLKNLVENGWNIVIVSNQKESHIGDKKLFTKLKKVASILDIPFHAFCARKEDEYRKPNNGILSLIPKEYGVMEFFVGDAAGRPGDHSDCDKKFAENSKIPFYTSNVYFCDEKVNTDYTFIPECLKENNGISILTMVIMIGFPGSGKTKYTQTILKDYIRVSRDELKTMPKCVKLCRDMLSKGKNVVIDNLNGTRETRKQFIDIANSCDAQCIAIHLNTSMAQSQTWNDSRERKVPKIVYYTYRKNFEPPTKEEGFDEIFVIGE